MRADSRASSVPAQAPVEERECGVTRLLIGLDGDVIVVALPCKSWRCVACRRAKQAEMTRRLHQHAKDGAWRLEIIESDALPTRQTAIRRAGNVYAKVPLGGGSVAVFTTDQRSGPVHDLDADLDAALDLMLESKERGHISCSRELSVINQRVSPATKSTEFGSSSLTVVEIAEIARRRGLLRRTTRQGWPVLALRTAPDDVYVHFLTDAKIRSPRTSPD